jgi:hypothetical protein
MKVLIGIPVHPELGVSPLFVRFLNQALSTLASNGIQADYLFMTTPSIETARESIVNTLLDAGYDKLVFLDSDVILDASALLLMLSIEAPIACCPYMTKRGGLSVYYITSDGSGGFRQVPLSIDMFSPQFTPVDACGLGAVVVDSDVFKKMKPPYFLFSFNEKTRQYISEDIYFFLKVRDELKIQPLSLSPNICKAVHLVSPTIGIDTTGRLIYFTV